MLASVENLKSSLSNMHMTIMDKIQGPAPAAPACANDIIPRDGNTSLKGEQGCPEKPRPKPNKKLHNIKNRSVKKGDNNVRRGISIPIKLLTNSASMIVGVAAIVVMCCFAVKIFEFADNQSQLKVRMAENASKEKIHLAEINLKEVQENKRLDGINGDKERHYQTKNNIITYLQAQYVIESQNAVLYKQACDDARTDWKILFATISSEYKEQLRQHRKSVCDEYITQKNKVENIQTQILAFGKIAICEQDEKTVEIV